MPRRAGALAWYPEAPEHSDGKKAPIPRYTEIKNPLAKLIRKQLGLE